MWPTSDGQVQIVADLGNPTIKSGRVLQNLHIATPNFERCNSIII